MRQKKQKRNTMRREKKKLRNKLKIYVSLK